MSVVYPGRRSVLTSTAYCFWEHSIARSFQGRRFSLAPGPYETVTSLRKKNLESKVTTTNHFTLLERTWRLVYRIGFHLPRASNHSACFMRHGIGLGLLFSLFVGKRIPPNTFLRRISNAYCIACGIGYPLLGNRTRGKT